MKYNHTIDGMRALAVISVLIFHVAPSYVPSGFLGVDVFFVLSGYLITGIIIREMDADTFSISSFYFRRARRIGPPLSIVLVATTVAGLVFLLPGELFELGKQVLGGILFSSNLLFWSQSGYFDSASIQKPLLHLWSLGVEEQFYLIWPPLLLLGNV